MIRFLALAQTRKSGFVDIRHSQGSQAVVRSCDACEPLLVRRHLHVLLHVDEGLFELGDDCLGTLDRIRAARRVRLAMPHNRAVVVAALVADELLVRVLDLDALKSHAHSTFLCTKNQFSDAPINQSSNVVFDP